MKVEKHNNSMRYFPFTKMQTIAVRDRTFFSYFVIKKFIFIIFAIHITISLIK